MRQTALRGRRALGHVVESPRKMRRLSTTVGAPSTLELPVIDIGPYVQGRASENQKKAIQEELRFAAEKYGFLYISGHGIGRELLDDVFSNLDDFFKLPLESKREIHCHERGSTAIRGYLGMFEQGGYQVDSTDRREEAEQTQLLDAKELFTMGPDFTDAEKAAGHKDYHPEMHSPNLWPRFPTEERTKEFRHTMDTYYNSVEDLAQLFYRIISSSLGREEDFFKDKVSHGMSSLNCNRYPRRETDYAPGQMGIGEHTDYEMCTFLLQGRTATGLDIYMEETGWTRMEPKEGTFVVNFGDLLARWTNDKWRSTVHRACNPEETHRDSLAFFSCCNYSAIVDPRDFLRPGETPKYKPVVAGDHMLWRVADGNLKEDVEITT